MSATIILKNLKNKLTLISYIQEGLTFYAKKNQSSALIMKNLIEITSELDKNNLHYSIDANYNIFII